MPKKPFYENLDVLFNPATVAVVGASQDPGKLGYHVMKSLTQGGYEGRIIPVNPGAKEIFDISAVPSLASFHDPVDLAIIVIPARLVPQIFEECRQNGVKGIVLITAGFKEIDDPAGSLRQSALSDLAMSAGIPVIGPNTFGIVNLHRRLNASFTPEFSWAERGGVTLVSQSGGVAHLLAFMAMRQHVKMSKIVGLGNRLNVDFADMLPYLMEDPDTKVITLYLEGLDEPRLLMEVAKAHRGKKPILAYKAGRATSGDRASKSHTGSLAGRQEIYAGAFRQAGVFSVDSAEALLDLAQAFSLCPLPKGPRVAILSAQAGPGMTACDVIEKEGLIVGAFAPETQATINELLPPLALRSNPVDMGPAWYNSSAMEGIIGAVMDDPNVDGILFLTMFASANRGIIADLSEYLFKREHKKPFITSILAPPGTWEEEVSSLQKAGALLNLPTPERAARVMAFLWQYRKMTNTNGGELNWMS